MKRMMQRYLIASGVFAVAALFFGVELLRGFECLLAFALTSLIAGLVQRRQLVSERGRVRRSDAGRSRRRRPRAVDKRDRRDSERPSRGSRPPRVLPDDEAAHGDWPQLTDYGW